jgi:site-specific recombinase XerD
MPRKKVEYHAVTHNGKNYFRVIVPKELNGGKQGRRYFENDKDAKAFATDLERERRTAHARFLALPSDKQNMVTHALDLIEGKDFDLVDAVKCFMAHNVTESRTLAQAIAECIDRKRATGKRHRSIVALANSLTRFSRGRESKAVKEITSAECEAWINAPEAKSVSTRRSRQIDLGTFFSFCVKRGYCAKRPIDSLEKYTHGKKSPRILTVAQCRAVLDAATETLNGEFLATIALQLFGGLRPYESYKVSREMIKDGHLRLDETITKTLDVRIVTINPTLKRWLAEAWKLRSKLPAFDAPRRMTIIRKASSVKPWPQDCLRHSFVSYHMEAHGWESTVEQAGHSLATSFNHYRALTTKAEAKRFWKLKPQSQWKNGLKL